MAAFSSVKGWDVADAMRGIPETVTVGGQTYTRDEVLKRLGEKYKGFDPAKLAGILKMLFTVFQSLLPLFMKSHQASPEHERSALALLATAADVEHPKAEGPILDPFLAPMLDTLASFITAKVPDAIGFAKTYAENWIHVNLP